MNNLNKSLMQSAGEATKRRQLDSTTCHTVIPQFEPALDNPRPTLKNNIVFEYFIQINF